MKRTEEVAHFLAKFPNASNLEIANELQITEGYAKKIVHDLKKIGVIEVAKDGDGRTVQVFSEKLKNRRADENLTRKERIEQLLDIVFEALENESQIDNIISAGHLAVKLLDRL